MIVTADGSVIRFVEDEVRDMGRQAAGVKGIDVAKGDQVVCLSAVKRRTDVFTVSEYGFAKRSYVPDFRRQSRGGSGITAAKINEKTGRLVALKCVREADEIIIATCRGYVTRIRAYDVDLRDRYTMGERVLELESGDRVASIWFLRE
jgi:DNA gyrase subunit A